MLALKRGGENVSGRVSRVTSERYLCFAARHSSILNTLLDRNNIQSASAAPASHCTVMSLKSFVAECGNPLSSGDQIVAIQSEGGVELGVITARRSPGGRFGLAALVEEASQNFISDDRLRSLAQLSVDDPTACEFVRNIVIEYVSRLKLQSHLRASLIGPGKSSVMPSATNQTSRCLPAEQQCTPDKRVASSSSLRSATEDDGDCDEDGDSAIVPPSASAASSSSMPAPPPSPTCGRRRVEAHVEMSCRQSVKSEGVTATPLSTSSSRRFSPQADGESAEVAKVQKKLFVLVSVFSSASWLEALKGKMRTADGVRKAIAEGSQKLKDACREDLADKVEQYTPVLDAMYSLLKNLAGPHKLSKINCKTMWPALELVRNFLLEHGDDGRAADLEATLYKAWVLV